ncbi:hypothetical protein MMC30_001168 [Trapelia coarctata]|nr:hypothetical protein [Trapelia coarctata]
MADPISVTGTTVGVVSLGITYLEDVSNRLQALRTILQAGSFPAAARQQVESAVLLCTGDIGVLEKKLAKIRSTKLPVGLRDKLKAHLRRAQYPFKEKKLRKLKGSIEALQTNLGVALSLLNV